MAQIDCTMLAHAVGTNNAMPAPPAASDLAAWATLMPANPRDRVGAGAMAALPSWAPIADAPTASTPAISAADQAALAAANATAAAQSHGAAISLLVTQRAAAGPIDPSAIQAGIGQVSANLPENLASTTATLAEHATRLPIHTANEAPPIAPVAQPASEIPQSAPPAPAASGWARPVASRPVAARATDTGQWGSRAWPAAIQATPSPSNWGTAEKQTRYTQWGTIASPPPQAPPPAGTRAIYRPLDAPDCDPGLLAGMANVANLYRQLSGRSLADPASLNDLSGTLASFNNCLAGLPEPAPPSPEMAGWASAGRGVSAARNQMGIDLMQPNAGPALQAAISERQAALVVPVKGWTAQRAQATTQWLELDQFARALDLPTNGPGALARLGSAARLMAQADLPPCASPTKAAAYLAQADNLAAIRDGFGIDPLSADGPARLSEAGAMLDRTLAAYPLPPAPNAEAARGLTGDALERLGRIDRSQAGDLGLQQVDARHAAVLTEAPLVLGVLDAISRQRGATMFMPPPTS